jgi:sugar-specific transcriptional regulator TrmB
MSNPSDPDELLSKLDLAEYEQTSLEYLFRLGRTTAPDLSEATGIPKARIYGVLDSLSDAGYVKVIPGRPKQYEPKPPATLLERAAENRRQEYESFSHSLDSIRDEFVETFGSMYEAASDDLSPTEELFHVVDVGEPSERETRALYNDATDQVCVITKSFEYFRSVEPSVESTLNRGVDVTVLMLHPSHLEDDNQRIQREISERIESKYQSIDVRFSEERLPWRGTIIDPSMSYDSGKAVLLVEEENIPLHKRQAAVTENASFVAGMKRYFDLVWTYESTDESPDAIN